jgi:hypothetical protein
MRLADRFEARLGRTALVRVAPSRTSLSPAGVNVH